MTSQELPFASLDNWYRFSVIPSIKTSVEQNMNCSILDDGYLQNSIYSVTLAVPLDHYFSFRQLFIALSCWYYNTTPCTLFVAINGRMQKINSSDLLSSINFKPEPEFITKDIYKRANHICFQINIGGDLYTELYRAFVTHSTPFSPEDLLLFTSGNAYTLFSNATTTI